MKEIIIVALFLPVFAQANTGSWCMVHADTVPGESALLWQNQGTNVSVVFDKDMQDLYYNSTAGLAEFVSSQQIDNAYAVTIDLSNSSNIHELSIAPISKGVVNTKAGITVRDELPFEVQLLISRNNYLHVRCNPEEEQTP